MDKKSRLSIAIVVCCLICTSAAQFSGQWSQSATATTEDPAHKASNVDGPPASLYWTPAVTTTQTDAIEIVIANSVCVSGVTVYEYQHIGMTIGIYALSPSGTWDQLYSGTSNYGNFDGSLGFAPNLIPVTYTTNAFKIIFDSSETGKYPQVDGFRVFGTAACAVTTLSGQWARHADASTENPEHKAKNIPEAPGSEYWTPAVTSTLTDTVEFTVDDAVCVAGIIIFEYQNTGLVKEIYSRSPAGTWDKLYGGSSNFKTFHGSLGFPATLSSVSYTTNQFKVVFDSSMSADKYPQVDGIRIFGRSACSTPATTGQWAQTATVSLDNPAHKSTNIPGPPTDNYWSPAVSSSLTDSVEITIQNKVCVAGISVYEYDNTGLTVGIYVKSPSGTWDQLWGGEANFDNTFDGALGFAPDLVPVNYISDTYKIVFDSSRTATEYPQVDGVRVFGTSSCALVTFGGQWTKTATATLEETDHKASNIPNAPTDAYWTPSNSNSLTDSVEITIENSICVAGITVFEFKNTGLTVGVYAGNPSGTWDKLWTGTSKFATFDGSLGYAPPLSTVTYTTNKFKVVFDSSKTGQYPQVDAIRVFGRSICPVWDTPAPTKKPSSGAEKLSTTVWLFAVAVATAVFRG